MTTPLSIPSRTLRCANGALYMIMALCTAAAAAYAFTKGHLTEPWHIALAIGGSILALLWGGYYAALRYRVDAEGLTHSLLWSSRFYPWSELISCTAMSTDSQGEACCTLSFSFTGGDISISSSLFSLDEVQELRSDLADAGALKTHPVSPQI